MIGLPRDGQKVRIWPFPGRKVQDGPRPVDHLGGGRWLDCSDDGRDVVWAAFYHQQLKCGDIMLHPYKPAQLAKPAASAEKSYSHHEASADHMKSLSPDDKPEPKSSKKDKE